MTRRTRQCLLASVFATCLAPPAVAQAPTTPLVRHAPPYEVRCHFADGGKADEAQRTVAEVWKLAVALFKPNEMARKTKLVVNVYPDKTAFAAALRHIGKSKLKDMQGFASVIDRTAHLYVSERPRFRRKGAGGKPAKRPVLDPMNRKVIAHEAFHLATFACMANRGFSQPRWFVEGIAEWAEIEVMTAGGWTKRGDRDYYEWHSINRARNLLTSGKLPKVADVLTNHFGDLSINDAYSVMNRFFVMLTREHAKPMANFIDVVRMLPPSRTGPQKFRAALQSALGDEVFAKLDEQLTAFVRNARRLPLPAQWYNPRDGSRRGGATEFQPGDPELHWLDRTTRKSYTMRATVTIHESGFPQADLVFGAMTKSPLRLSLVPGGGAFLMTKIQTGDDEWALLAANRDAPKLVTAEPMKLRVLVSGNRVTAKLDGVVVLRADLPGFDPRGRWGCGGPPGSRSSWKRLGLR